MGALPANSREKNSSQEQQQRSNANQTHRPNLNVLFSQPRLPIHRSFNLKSIKLVKRSKTCRGEWVKPLTNYNLWSMLGDLEDDLEEHIDVLL
ncbi:hypothetical protein V6Z12_A06G044400 [Gossypium hirsutum]